MIHSTKRDSYWSFWCQGWSNHQDQEVFWRNRTVEAVETTEVAEADEINVAAKVSKAWKITTEDFRVIQVLEFSFILIVWKKKFFGRNMKYQVELWHLFCQRLLRPANVIFLKTGWWNTNVQSSWTRYTPLSDKIIGPSTPQSHLLLLVMLWDTL